jgi:hypothetical protein
MATNLNRVIPKDFVKELENLFIFKDNTQLVELMLKQELYPIKDSYVAYLKRDNGAINRNPQTVNRLAGKIYDIGFLETLRAISLPKETNRQIGPMFKLWLEKGSLGTEITDDFEYFCNYKGNIILNCSDNKIQKITKDNFGFNREKGLDFMAKFNNKIVIGEAKFLSDFGGHQNAQLEDALATLNSTFLSDEYEIIPIAILDGVLFINSNNKMHRKIIESSKTGIIISALLLSDFLYSL